MGLVQKASGINSATFASPTTAGNNIVVLVSLNNTNGIVGCADNKGQSYLSASSFPQMGNVGTFWFARSFTVAGVTTITVTLTPAGNCQVWIYECLQVNTLVSPDDADDAFDDATGTSATPTGSGLFNSNFFGTQHIYFAICAVGGNGGVVNGAAAGWTLDTVQSGNAPAYFDNSTGNKTVSFTCSPSSGFSISEVDFYIPTAPTTGNIVIVKKTVPSGATQAFTFTPSYGASFTLTDGQSNNSGPLSPGTYSVGESPEPGWSTTTSADSSAIVVTAGVTTTITFINTNPNANQQGGGGGIGSGKNIYFDYNINQQCWNLPGILQVPASALGSIETSPGVWRLLISGVLSGVNMLAYRDINNFTDLGLAYQPNAVFGSIQLADPGALAKFGGRGGFVLEYTMAGLAPTLSVLPNDMGATLANEIGSQITGNFVSLSVGSNPLPSPPTLGAQPKSYRSLLYYYLLGKGLSAFVRHLQFQISAPAENAPTELIGFSIFGDEKGEAPPGQLPQVQGR